MQDLFGSSSENSDDDDNVQQTDDVQETLPSTQAHMDELFGDDDSDIEQEEHTKMKAAISDISGSEDEESPKASPKDIAHTGPEADLNFSDIEDDSGPTKSPSPVKQSPKDDEDSPAAEKSPRDEEMNSPSSSPEVSPKEEKIMPTTQDLFGDDDLDVSSDEDEEVEQKVEVKEEQRPRHESIGDYDERPPTPEKDDEEEEKEEEGLSIAIELPRCNMALGKELYFVKLPNFLSVDTKPFDPALYEDEIDEDEILDEEGRTRLKLKVENTIRWRYGRDKDGNEIKESNCRFVRWSDGSLSMHLGNEVFDVFKMPIQGEQNHLFVQQGTGLQAQAVFKNKLTFRPQSTSSQTHRKMTMSIAERMSKTQKIKMMPATEHDPETQRLSLMKKEDERMRAQNRRESQQRRMREKNSTKGLTSSFMEQDMDDEEDFDDSLAAIKNKFKKDVQGARSKPYHDVYSDDSENEAKLRNAKLDIQSDDDDSDDEEIRRKKEELARKKKAKKVIVESDDEDESD